MNGYYVATTPARDPYNEQTGHLACPALEQDTLMKRRAFAILTAALIALSAVGGASAGKDSLGTPGKPNCVGQTMAFLTSPSPVHPVDQPGIGNLRKWTMERDPNHPTDVRMIAEGWCSGKMR